ncbi:cytochrome c-type biogenesis protein CcmH [Micromonospora sp. NPDC050686]|uniref:cytochrome c-type biogenesis protein CcmH n=1 Tax=Micromonospora sp. NPDC050686 TaxID=3154631 RepID=UPI0033C11ED6
MTRGGLAGRRLLVALGLAALLALAVTGLARSAGPGAHQDPVRALAAELRCPACQGESVADSRSPIAASMRQAIADQVAQGRSPEQIRRWFVDRYGPEVLARPPLRGTGLLLWAVPVVALLGAAYAARRSLRPIRTPGAPRRRRPAGRPARRPAGARPGPDEGSTPGRRPRVAWWLSAVGLAVLVAAVAVAADRLTPPAPPPPATDPAAVALRLARDLEGQQRYDAAAQMYREALRERPDDAVRLRLAFAMLRSSDPAGAERTAREVLDHTPDSPDGLLVLGLAQRTTRPGDAPRTLRRFVAVAPDHPAAGEIRRLLTS